LADRRVRTFCSRAELTGKNTGKNLVFRSPVSSEGARSPCATGSCAPFQAARTSQITGNGNRDNREAFSNNRESGARLSLYFCASPTDVFVALRRVPEGSQGPPIAAVPVMTASCSRHDNGRSAARRWVRRGRIFGLAGVALVACCSATWWAIRRKACTTQRSRTG
jgi:hypothetical protein